MKIVYYCQHVLGIGHFFRVLEICRALKRHDVVLVSGGPEIDAPLPGHVRLVRLPGLMMDPDFTTLLPTETDRSLEGVKEERCRILWNAFQTETPDLFLVELYPFGRGSFRFELEPLLEGIALGRLPACRVVSSLRDILVERKDPAAFERRVVRALNRHFDALLVHADPSVVRLDETFSGLDAMNIPVVYTGFVAPGPDQKAAEKLRRNLRVRPGQAMVLASAGGGRVGFRVLEAVARAVRTMETERIRLFLFSGPHLAEEEFKRLHAFSQENVVVERFTPDFLTYMAAADLSISMAGYNTCMNILATGTPALVWPFAQNHEQRRRAEKLAALGALDILDDDALAPEHLAGVIKRKLDDPPNGVAPVDLNGAARTARWLETWSRPGGKRHPYAALWLTPGNDLPGRLERCLDAAAARLGPDGEPFVLFRADDVGVPGRNLERLLHIFAQHRIPLSLAVVPAWLTGSRWETILSLAGENASLWCWHQHGWRHVNHEPEGKKQEFGPSRSRERIRRDLEKGRSRLEGLIRGQFFPVFTPPWNRCSSITLELLRELGYHAVSRTRSHRSPLPGDVPDYSINVDLHTRNESDAGQAWNRLFREMEDALSSGWCGIMIHHQRMNDEAFHFLEILVSALSRRRGRIVNFRDLVRADTAVDQGCP